MGKKKENSCVDDFWNELAIEQIAAGGSPSVITKDMGKVLKKGKSKKEEKKAKKSAKKIKKTIDVNKSFAKGMIYKMKNPGYK